MRKKTKDKNKGESDFLIHADSFGALFRGLRERSDICLEKLSGLTKINRQYLEYLESEEFSKLPPPVYARGFIIRCGNFFKEGGRDWTPELLHLYAARTNELVETRADTAQHKSVRSGFMVGPQQISFFFTAIFLVLIAFFLTARFTPFLFAPSIEIVEPRVENTVVNFSKIHIAGRVNFVSSLTLNGGELYIGENGEFAKDAELKEGVNRLVIEAKSLFGRTKELVMRVVYIKN